MGLAPPLERVAPPGKISCYTHVSGWLDYVVIIPPQPSQAKARLGFWIG